jgi:hypothetical protein
LFKSFYTLFKPHITFQFEIKGKERTKYYNNKTAFYLLFWSGLNNVPNAQLLREADGFIRNFITILSAWVPKVHQKMVDLIKSNGRYFQKREFYLISIPGTLTNYKCQLQSQQQCHMQLLWRGTFPCSTCLS